MFVGGDFVRANALSLLALAVSPALLKVLGAYILAYMPLERRQFILIVLLLCAADAWLLSAAGMLSIERLRGLRSSAADIASRALHLLPKVLVSYSIVIGLVAFATSLSPLMVLLTVFFFWAPAFVVGEFYAKEVARPERDPYSEDEDFDLLDEEDDQSLFAGKDVWEIGLIRSYQFAIRNMWPTVELIALFWCAHVVPSAFTRLVFGPYQSFASLTLEFTLQSVLIIVVAAISSRVFLSLLPREAKGEMDLPFVAGESSVRRDSTFNTTVFMGLVALSFLCSWYSLKSADLQKRMPVNVAVDLMSARKSGDVLTVRVRLIDNIHSFSWLNPKAFNLVLAGAANGKEPKIAPDKLIPEKLGEELTTPANAQLYAIESFDETAYDANGKVLRQPYLPYFGTLDLELSYRLQPSHPKPDAMAIFYVSPRSGERVNQQRLLQISSDDLTEDAVDVR